MLIVFRDIDTGKITQYNSGDSKSNVRHPFTIEVALNEIKKWRAKDRIIKYYDDSDYAKFKFVYNNPTNGDQEAQHEDD